MRIVIDAFGGDNAPLCNIKGAADAVKEYGITAILVGKSDEIKSVAEQNGVSLEGIEIVDAPDVFSMHSAPTDLLKAGKDSSLAVGMKYAAEGNADAFVSAGSTGAVVVGGTFICKRIKGVKRAALGSIVPTKDGKTFITDIGANAECRPEMLCQFASMAAAYLAKVEGIENPTIGLLNIGTEDTKGGELQIEAYKLLKGSGLNFIGNVEGREVANGAADAIIADGFTGNIALKMYEGVSLTLFKIIKNLFKTNFITLISGALIKPYMGGLKKKFDYAETGGAPLLGVKVPVIKAHGSSDARAIKNAIRQAVRAVENNLVGSISEGLAALKTDDTTTD